MIQRVKKIALFSLIGAGLAASTIGVLWGFSAIAEKLNSVNVSRGYERDFPVFPNIKEVLDPVSTEIKKDENGNTNILLLGISGEEYISGELADTIILTSINEERSKASLISIPRDLWVKDPEGNFQKINEFYKLGGGGEKPNTEAQDVIKNKIEEITGQKVHYTAIVNLAGIEKFVDLIGGVDTEEGYKNGEQALAYIRDRSRPGGDFDRMERQQKLLMAVFDKLEEEPVVDTENEGAVMEMLNVLNEYFAMDIPILKLTKFNKVIMGLNTEDVGLYTITPSTESLLYSGHTEVNGQQLYTLHPTAGHEDYSEIQKFIKNIVKN